MRFPAPAVSTIAAALALMLTPAAALEGHLAGDVPALLIVAGVLGWLLHADRAVPAVHSPA